MYKHNFSIKIVILLLLMSSSVFADEAERRVIVVNNLQAISTLAAEKNLPVMMFFAAEDCEFCDALEADYLGAMSLAAEYSDKVIIRKVMIDSYDNIYDFKGKNVSAEDFSSQFKVRVTPTLMLVNHRGDELTKKIIGYNRSGLFGAYLDDAIDTAVKKTEKSIIN